MSKEYVRAVLEMPKESASGLLRMLLLAIAEHANGDGIASPGNKLLAEETTISERQVQRMIPQLADAGILEVVEQGNGRGRTRIMRLLFEPAAIIYKRVTNDARKDDTICHPLPTKRTTPDVTLYPQNGDVSQKGDKKGDKRVTFERERVTFEPIKGDMLPEVEADNLTTKPITTEPLRGDQGYTAHACEIQPKSPPLQFSAKPNEYLPGIADPRQRQTPQVQLNERVIEAQTFGVPPERFRVLCDELLSGFGKKARAYAEEDERSLNHAQKLALELIRMDGLFRVEGGIERVFKSWQENDYRGDTLPTSEQFMDHASLMSAGRVVNNRRDKSNASRNGKPEFGILTRGAQDNQRAAPAPTAEEIERVRAERRAAKAAGVSIQQWQQQRSIPPA